jgi:hypothetical protein
MLAFCLALMTSAYAREDRSGLAWAPHVNERFGFRLQYPTNVFKPERSSEAGDGEILIGLDGEARLLVGAFENVDGHSVASYMGYIRNKSYPGYRVDYAPRAQTWFVLSGQNDQNIFYEKVMFSCGGRIISLIYPTRSKARFDPIVEGIEKTFRPAHACDARS